MEQCTKLYIFPINNELWQRELTQQKCKFNDINKHNTSNLSTNVSHSCHIYWKELYLHYSLS